MGRHLSRRVLVYALGGGRGHAVRGCVVARALDALGAHSTVLVRAAEVPDALGLPHLVCPRPESPGMLREHVLRLCRELEVDTLVLDTFPEGLLGELEGPWPGPRRVALLRCRRDASTARFESAVRSVDAAVDLEPHLEWCVAGVPSLGPITRLNVADPPMTLDVLIAASEPSLADFTSRLAPRLSSMGLRVRTVESAAFPIDFSNAIPRVLVGPAGFNLTYEAQALGIWHVALPRPRSHDDQHRRARRVAKVVRSPQAVERLVAQLCSAGRAARRAPLHEAEAVAQFVLGE